MARLKTNKIRKVYYVLWGVLQFFLLAIMLLRAIGGSSNGAYVRSLWAYYAFSTLLISLMLLALPFFEKRFLLIPKKPSVFIAVFFLLLAHILGFVYPLSNLTASLSNIPLEHPLPWWILIPVQLIGALFILYSTVNLGIKQQMHLITKIFISYSRKDSEVAHQVKEILRDNGFEVEIDVEAFAFGDHIEERIGQAINNTELTIGIISENSLKSVWVGTELINTVLQEKFLSRQRFIGVLLDQSIFTKGFYNQLKALLESQIQQLDASITGAVESGDGLSRFVEDRERIRNYIHYQDTLFKRLQQYIQVNAFVPDERKKNLHELARQLKQQVV